MSLGYSQTPRIMELAALLEADIRRRQLRPGDPYLPLTKAARMLGVGSSVANRALQLLEQRGLLERVQRRGTFVRSLHRELSPGAIRRVCMLVNPNYAREGVVADGVIVGIQRLLPGADVQFNFLPVTDPTDYVDGLIGEILRAKEPAGLVLTKVPFAVQRAVSDSGLPAVVHGSLYPSIERLGWVEQDNLALARILANYAIGHGAAQVCALTREVMFPGDNVVLQEIGRLLGGGGYRAGSYSVCHLPDDPHAIMAEVAQIVHRHPTDLCLIARSEAKAEAAAASIDRLKLKGRRRPRLIVSGMYQRPAGNYPHPYVYPAMRAEEIGAAIGGLLASQATNPAAAPGHVVIPVELAGG